MDGSKEMMYDKNNYGTYHIRSFQKIWTFKKLSPLLARQKDSQSSPGSNYQSSGNLVNRREFHQELPQAPQKARSKEEIILTIQAYTLIISLVGGVYGKR